MRLLCVGNRYPPWSIGGYEVLWADSVARLRASGHDVRVLTTVPDRSDLPSHEAAIEPESYRELRWYWHEHGFPKLGLRGVIELERANAEVFARHLHEFEPDFVLWWSMGGMSLSLLGQARSHGVPSIGVVGDDWIVYGPHVDGWIKRWRSPLLAPVGSALGRRLGIPASVELAAASTWVFISQYTLDSARAAGMRVDNAVVAHPGVDSRLFVPHDPEPWGSRLLYCGRVEERKGVQTAVQALALLADATLTLDGPVSDEYRERLRREAAALGVLDRVAFQLSPREQLPRVYAAADVVLFPVSWREPWGLVPLEAMASGRPVIASDAGGGAAEYLAAGHNCLQFEPHDAAGLAGAVARLAGDRALREALRTGGYETAARFTADGFHDALERQLGGVVAPLGRSS